MFGLLHRDIVTQGYCYTGSVYVGVHSHIDRKQVPGCVDWIEINVSVWISGKLKHILLINVQTILHTKYWKVTYNKIFNMPTSVFSNGQFQ